MSVQPMAHSGSYYNSKRGLLLRTNPRQCFLWDWKPDTIEHSRKPISRRRAVNLLRYWRMCGDKIERTQYGYFYPHRKTFKPDSPYTIWPTVAQRDEIKHSYGILRVARKTVRNA